MLKEGIHNQIILRNDQALTCNGRSWLSYIYEGRKQLMDHVRANVHPQAFGWMKALIFGETDEVDEDTIDWFRDYNLAHVLAISGLHVGLTIGGVYFVIFRTGIGTRRQAILVVLVMLPLYAVLAGAAPSVIGASIMAFILLFFTLFNWNQ